MSFVLSVKIKIAVLCVLAAFLNLSLSIFFMNYLRFTLFLDTVFTAAIAFSFGLIPGIAVAVLTWILPCMYWKGLSLFVLCSIAEVLLICALKPAAPNLPYYANHGSVPKEKILASYLVIAAKLMLLYIVCALSISVIGGILDYVSQLVTDTDTHYYSIENTFKLGLMMSNLPKLAVNILSRITINIVDRFIVVFGGYFISLGLRKVVR